MIAARTRPASAFTYLDHFGDLTEMVLDSLATIETGGLGPFYHLLEVAVVRVPEDLCKVAAGPVCRSGGVGTADSLER